MEHDALSKTLFALPQVETDVLRIVARGWVHLLDLDTLERVSAEHAATDLTQRAGDLAWRVRFRAGRLADGTKPWLLQPTELQSTPDARMGERQLEYAFRHFQALWREGSLAREGEEPRVLPVVVYDGERRWRRDGGAPKMPSLLQPGGYVLLDAGAGALEDWPLGNRVTSWARLVRSRGPDELLSAYRDGVLAFHDPGDAVYREALGQWAIALLEAMAPDGGVPALPEFEDEHGELMMTTLLEANFAKWEAGVMERGRAKGLSEGRSEGLSEGRAEGRAEERERLRGLVGELGPETAAQVAKLLDRED